jgi:hypothetical protein
MKKYGFVLAIAILIILSDTGISSAQTTVQKVAPGKRAAETTFIAEPNHP